MTNQLSLAGWSLHRRFLRTENPLRLLDLPRVARQEFCFSAIELNEPFFAATDDRYLRDLKRAADAEGVLMLNIAIDRQGNLSAADANERAQAIIQHKQWFGIAVAVGCTAIRANTGGHGEPVTPALIARCTESFASLAEAGSGIGIKILIENHGGISANPDTIVQIMREVNSPWIGTLPDFGNFAHDILYEGLTKIAPFAHAVHAKMHDFGPDGEETRMDIGRCLRIFRDAGYTGSFGIEYEGQGDDHEGVLKAKALMERHLL